MSMFSGTLDSLRIRHTGPLPPQKSPLSLAFKDQDASRVFYAADKYSSFLRVKSRDMWSDIGPEQTAHLAKSSMVGSGDGTEKERENRCKSGAIFLKDISEGSGFDWSRRKRDPQNNNMEYGPTVAECLLQDASKNADKYDDVYKEQLYKLSSDTSEKGFGNAIRDPGLVEDATGKRLQAEAPSRAASAPQMSIA